MSLHLCSSVRGESISLTTIADTTLSQTYPENNFGAMSFLNSGTTQNGYTNRGLLKFDIDGVLPPEAYITSATLTLEVVGTPGEDFPAAQFNLHRMLQPWGEGRGTNTLGGGAGQGSSAADNEATWSHRFAFTQSTWSQPGAAAPVDFTNQISSGVTVGGVDQSPYTFPTSAQLVADLQLWLAHPDLNFGWLLHCQQETTKFTARRFGSRENEFSAPRLDIEFLRRPILRNVTKLGDAFTFSFAAQAGQNYQVDYLDSLTSATWLTLTNFGAILVSQELSCTDSNLSSQRSYRVVVEGASAGL